MAWLFAHVVIEPASQSLEQLERLVRDTLHELNLPLATIKANLQLLERMAQSEKSAIRLKRISEAANELTERYEELDRQIQRSLQQSRIEEVELASYLRARVELVRDVAAGMEFSLDLEPCIIQTDRIGLRQTIDNLLSNAIKYNRPNGRISIKLNACKLEMSDEGEGMEESEIVRLFERYYQGINAKEGQGIGLALVKEFCDRHSIAIHLESKKGVGSRITLDFSKIAQRG